MQNYYDWLAIWKGYYNVGFPDRARSAKTNLLSLNLQQSSQVTSVESLFANVSFRSNSMHYANYIAMTYKQL
jgi:hypothetical protein